MSSIGSFVKLGIVTASPDESVAVVAKRMRSEDVGAVVLIRDGGLAGIFSERDLVNRVVAEGLAPATTKVGDVATGDVISVTKDDALRVCAEKLRDHHLRHLVVVDGGKPVGVVSARDFFGELAARMEDLMARARYDEQLRANLDPYDHMGGGYGR